MASRKLEDTESRAALARTLDGLTTIQAVAVVRAFSYFSLLANIAEDRHHIRRQRDNRREGAAPLPSTVRGVFAEARERGVTREEGAARLARVRVHPVLTAHPTEVQRKSNLDSQLAIAERLARLDAADALPEEHRGSDHGPAPPGGDPVADPHAARREARREDEIENALAYFHYTFIEAVPAIAADVEDSIAQLPGGGARPDLPPVMAVGSWVGGDRDGNPFVTADMLEAAFSRQSEVIFDHYLEQVHALGGELPLSGLLTRVHARSSRRSRSARPTARPIARTSPTAARSPESTRASRRRPTRSA